ncbi:RDD family protein [Nocardia pseudobrasiliensis]|uniref:RDD family protein n=1 Tax=Nocardia pseudobrasiliensis TaxID=45979 RepID=A0A370I112_9NOCA|nr:RDD family protein [Nocardia pseudobrasiliensis]RDI64443.1 RDD family protein [Nocardia pseudobrasiliensis]
MLALLTGLACLPLSLFVIDLQDRVSSQGAGAALGISANLAAVFFVLGTIFGGVCTRIRWRRRKALKRHPWTAWPINYVSTGRNEWVELLDAQGRPVSALILSTWPKDVGKLVNQRTREIWFAGDPAKYGIVSRPGGADLRYAYYSKGRQPPRFTFRDRESDPRLSSAARGYEMHRENGKIVMKGPGSGSPGSTGRYGRLDDPAFPSPRKLRRALAFAVDMLIHIACGIAAALAASPSAITAIRAGDWRHLEVNLILAVGVWIGASFVDRVVIQSIFHTTIGKAIFGLVAIRPDTGQTPAFGRLLAAWLFHLFLPLAIFSNGEGPDNWDYYFFPAVRRRDLKPPNPITATV